MLTGPASTLSLLALIYLLYIFSVLSRKLGNVTKMKPWYRAFYYASGLVGLAIVMNWFVLTSRVTPNVPQIPPDDELLYVMVFDGALAVAVTASVLVAWRYWGWLFKEHGR